MTIMVESAANGYIVTCQGGKKLVYESMASLLNAVKDILDPPRDPEPAPRICNCGDRNGNHYKD